MARSVMKASVTTSLRRMPKGMPISPRVPARRIGVLMRRSLKVRCSWRVPLVPAVISGALPLVAGRAVVAAMAEVSALAAAS
jgi:hypothetical protein